MPAACNSARGEALLTIDGKPRRLCVTLGALAELEAIFDARSFGELGDRLSRLTATDLLPVVAALCAGGGEALSRSELACARIDPVAAAEAVARAFHLAFGDDA